MTTKRHPFSIAAFTAILFQFAITLSAGEFNPNDALTFLETLTTLDMKKPDINILARLFKARKAVGLHNSFVKYSEWCVCTGVVAAGRGDLYFKSLKAECSSVNSAEFEAKLTRPCPDCTGGNSTKTCHKCHGTGQCVSCGGRGNRGSMKDLEGVVRVLKCGTCKGSGRCILCNGNGKVKADCAKCQGTHRIWDEEVALKQYENYALGLLYYICKGFELAEVPENIKLDFAKLRETADAKFGRIREIREEEADKEERGQWEYATRAKRERKHREEREEHARREREKLEAFEREQLAKGLVKYGGKWMTEEEKHRAEERDEAYRREAERLERAARERQESLQRELEKKRPEIEQKAANLAVQRVDEFLNAIYDGENLFSYFISNSHYDTFMQTLPIRNTSRYWTIHNRVRLGTPVNTTYTGKPMSVVRVDYLGQVYDFTMEFSSVTGNWHIHSVEKMSHGGIGSGYNWQQMPLERFQSLLNNGH